MQFTIYINITAAVFPVLFRNLNGKLKRRGTPPPSLESFSLAALQARNSRMSRRLLGLLFAVAMTCANRYAVEHP